MVLHRVLAVGGLLWMGTAAGAQEHPAIPWRGPSCTAVNADGSISVQGVPVVLSGKTHIYEMDGGTETEVDHLTKPYLGEYIWVLGRYDWHSKSIHARYLRVWPPTTQKITGKAIIDLADVPSGDAREIRADGYRLKMTAATKLHLNEPLASINDIGTNQWITYTGVRGEDGVVVVSEAEVWGNRVDVDEAQLRAKREFDPAAVTEDQKQGVISRKTLGVDPKKLPAHQDEDLQTRVSRIGASLVPAYQKALPASDPTKINFRFQVVDSDHIGSGLALGSGVVQVPASALALLATDGQIAAVLADDIAAVIEKQALLNGPSKFALATVKYGAMPVAVAAAVVSPATLLFGAFASTAASQTAQGVSGHIDREAERQSGRVGLTYMHDAGYDVAEAPLAW